MEWYCASIMSARVPVTICPPPLLGGARFCTQQERCKEHNAIYVYLNQQKLWCVNGARGGDVLNLCGPNRYIEMLNGSRCACQKIPHCCQYCVHAPGHVRSNPRSAAAALGDSIRFKFFMTMNIFKDLWQVPLHADSQDTFTVGTPDGRWKPTRTHQGYMDAT